MQVSLKRRNQNQTGNKTSKQNLYKKKVENLNAGNFRTFLEIIDYWKRLLTIQHCRGIGHAFLEIKKTTNQVCFEGIFWAWTYHIPEHTNPRQKLISLKNRTFFFIFCFRVLKINSIVDIHCPDMLICFGVIWTLI